MYNYYPITSLKIDEFSSIDLVDITVTAKLKKLLTEYEGIAITPYTIVNGERPDVVSMKLYDSPYYDYIILMVNNITNIYDEWPRDEVTFNNFIIEKYGSFSFARDNIKNWFDSLGNIVSQEFWGTLPSAGKYTETYLQYETRINNKKSFIRVLDYPYVVKFESDTQEILNQ